jgi:hypothetical protein
MATSTPLLERRRKISYTNIIPVWERPFSKHPYIDRRHWPSGVVSVDALNYNGTGLIRIRRTVWIR